MGMTENAHLYKALRGPLFSALYYIRLIIEARYIATLNALLFVCLYLHWFNAKCWLQQYY